MNRPDTILKSGTEVVTHTALGDTEGMLVGPENLAQRRPRARGTIAGPVAGHLGDVYWVDYGDAHSDRAASRFDEIDVVAEPAVTTRLDKLMAWWKSREAEGERGGLWHTCAGDPGAVPRTAYLRLLPWIALSLTLFGCGGKVVVDASNALVIKEPAPGDLCDVLMQPPAVIYLLVASQPVTCAPPVLQELQQPQLNQCPPGLPPAWELCVALAPALVPQTIDFEDVGSNITELAFVDEYGDCLGGSIGVGTLAITAVHPASMMVTISGTDPVDPAVPPGYGADGTYDALRCP
jgi:hypothetical protein